MNDDETHPPFYSPLPSGPQIADGDAVEIPTGIRAAAPALPRERAEATPGAPTPAAMDGEARAGLSDLVAALDESARVLARAAVTLPTLAWAPPELARELAGTLKKRAAARRGLQRELVRFLDVYPTPPVLGLRPTHQAVHLCWREARRALHKGDLPALLRALSTAERALDHRRQELARASLGLPLGALLARTARVTSDPLGPGRAAAA